MKLLLTGIEGPDILLQHVRTEADGEVHIYESLATVETMTLEVFND